MSVPGFATSLGALSSLRSTFLHGADRSGVTTLSSGLERRGAVPRVRRGGFVMQLGAPQIQIGRPKTSIKKSSGVINNAPAEPEAEAGKGAAKARPRRKTLADEIPMYKVILLGDEEYVEGHVVTQLQKTVQVDKKEASRIFGEAQNTGSSVCCVVCEEHAEFYAQQLKRQEIYVTIEKDE